MGQTDFHFSYSEDTIGANSYCARCGNTAEIHLALLGEMPQRSGSFCLECSQTLLHDLQNQYAAIGHASTPALDAAHPTFSHGTTHHDDSEGGIIFWEGHGWSSDGPFAGA